MVAAVEMIRERAGLAAAGAALMVAAALRFWEPTDDPSTSLCLFRRCTGHACPGCGMTRAVSYLLKGDWDRTIFYHPLAPLAGLQILAGLGMWAAYSLGVWKPKGRLPVEGILYVNLALLLVVWVVRASLGVLPPV